MYSIPLCRDGCTKKGDALAAPQKSMRSNGKAGEEAAEYWFARHGWHMTKCEPAVKNLGPVFGKPGQFRAVYTDSGTPDYIGHYRYVHIDGDIFYRVVYCEVKEAHGKTWPASKLTPEQRAFMAGLPAGTAFVFLLWNDGGTGEMYPFIASGSYKCGQGQK